MTRTDFIKKIVNAFQLDANLETIPEKVASSFVPVFQVNIPVPVIREIRDAALNDSDKTLTVPNGKIWNVISIFCSLITTVSVGDRLIQIFISDPNGNNIFGQSAKNVQIASTTERYNFIKGIREATEITAGFHDIPLPTDLVLSEGFQIQILDSAAIAAAADDLEIIIMVEENDMVEGSTVNEAL